MLKILSVMISLFMVMFCSGTASAKSNATSAIATLKYDLENTKNAVAGQTINATLSLRATSDLEYLTYSIDNAVNATIENTEPTEFRNIKNNEVVTIRFKIKVVATPCRFDVLYGTTTATVSESAVEYAVIGTKQ